MSNYYLVPYNYLHTVDSWTVENLIFDSKQEEDRAPLNNFVLFNKERFDIESIDPDREYPYIEIKSISMETGSIQPVFTRGSELPTRAKLVGRKGDILVSIVRPERGIIAIIPSELDGCVVSSTFVVLTPQKISPEYLYLLLKDNDVRREFGLMARGTTTPTLGIKELKNYSLPLRKVPSDLDISAKDLYSEWKREGNQKRALREIVEDIFRKKLLELETVVDDEQNQYIALPYEELMDRWDVQFHIDHSTRRVEWSVHTKKLGDLGDLKVGAPLRNKDDGEGETPYIRVQDLDDDSLYVESENLVYVKEENKEETSRGFLLHDDILISRIGNFGRSALVQKELDRALANHNLAIFHPKSGVILPRFLAYFLKTNWAKEQLNTFATGLILQINFLKEMLIPVPSLAQQRLIIAAIEQEYTTNKKEELEKETLRFTHQIECVERVSNNLINGNKRALIQIATGAGKTSILTSVIRRLIKSGRVKNVLYLTDIRMLAEQFKQICGEKIPDQPCYLIDSNSVIERNKGIFAGVNNEVSRDMVPYFDLIILDEFNPNWSWLTEIKRIEGFILGVTSTPIQFNSNYNEVLRILELEGLTYTYDLQQAISDNHIINFE